jgi:hypothetical protein
MNKRSGSFKEHKPHGTTQKRLGALLTTVSHFDVLYHKLHGFQFSMQVFIFFMFIDHLLA